MRSQPTVNVTRPDPQTQRLPRRYLTAPLTAANAHDTDVGVGTRATQIMDCAPRRALEPGLRQVP